MGGGGNPNIQMTAGIQLDVNGQCSPAKFKELWKNLPIGATVTRTLKPGGEANVESLANSAYIKTRASGKGKYFFFAQEVML